MWHIMLLNSNETYGEKDNIKISLISPSLYGVETHKGQRDVVFNKIGYISLGSFEGVNEYCLMIN